MDVCQNKKLIPGRLYKVVSSFSTCDGTYPDAMDVLNVPSFDKKQQGLCETTLFLVLELVDVPKSPTSYMFYKVLTCEPEPGVIGYVYDRENSPIKMEEIGQQLC